MMYSTTTGYAIRAVSHLATLREGERMLVRDLASTTGMPQQFLGKILHRLAARGLLDSAKGRGGGFRLARPASSVTVADVVDVIEGQDTTRACVLGLEECDERQPCPMHDEWVPFRSRLLERVDTMTFDRLGANLAAKRASARTACTGPESPFGSPSLPGAPGVGS